MVLKQIFTPSTDFKYQVNIWNSHVISKLTKVVGKVLTKIDGKHAVHLLKTSIEYLILDRGIFPNERNYISMALYSQ